jgi:hypothetical protein
VRQWQYKTSKKSVIRESGEHMKLQQRDTVFLSSLKAFALLGGLWLFVLWVNFPILSFDMMYFEQPVLYLVNQKITSVYDLIHVYLHPQLLDALSIPFFRPSGHFLAYQVITTFLDWHNTKGFLAVNFFFLALSCYLFIKLYALFFPRYVVGGYIACGIYLMHPALLLSRLSPMHFEFACIFFLLLGFYCFVLFCKKNLSEASNVNSSRFKHQYLLALSLIFYFISVTFKEVGLMLGPVMALYFCMALYRGQPFFKYLSTLGSHKDVRQILMLLVVATLTFTVYLTMAWQIASHPIQNSEVIHNAPQVLGKFVRILFGFTTHNVDDTSLQADTLVWEAIIFPPLLQWTLWILLAVMLLCVVNLYVLRRNDCREFLRIYQKSFLFLVFAVLAFVVMPVIWGRARPWHLALSLVFVSMMMGFSCEYLGHVIMRKNVWINCIGIFVAIALGMMAIPTATANIDFIKKTENNFALELDRNAVLYPPAIKSQLNAESVVVVEDSTVHSDYLLGDSVYPFEFYGGGVDIHRLLPNKGFYAFPYVYGGTLFRWAYLMPSLHEQVYPFQIDKMRDVAAVTIYNWLQHYNNIFCLGYDDKANWHDRTLAFKKNLLIEKARRRLVVNQYRVMPVKAADLSSRFIVRLPFANAEYCKFRCDSNHRCKAFAYVEEHDQHRTTAYCYFQNTMAAGVPATCQFCQTFVKV